MDDLDSQTAVVTGGSQGIGAKIARKLADHGAHVIILDITDGTEIADEISSSGSSGSATYRYADVTDERSVESAVADTEIDVLINNAGYFGPLVNDRKRFDDITVEEWEKVFDVNVTGVFIVTKSCIGNFTQNGKIVNISSNTVNVGWEGFMHYVASKAAVVGMTRVMANELGDEGINVNAIMPGLTSSATAQEGYGQSFISEVANERVIEGEIQPDDIANAAAFLSSHRSHMVTGQVLTVDGGMTFY
jgi:3-oxoacyl-[acyl-carrier protein] reductase